MSRVAIADAGIQHRLCGARQQGPPGYHDHDCRGTVVIGERQEDIAALFVIIGSGQANRAWPRTFGFVARPWAPVATLLAVGTAGATWGECGAAVVAFAAFRLPPGGKLAPAA